MKKLTNLSGQVESGEIRPRGHTVSVLIEDDRCPGWFLEMSLTGLGLRMRVKRTDGPALSIPLEELLKLARTSAPELFAPADWKPQPEASLRERMAENGRARRAQLRAETPANRGTAQR